MTEDAKVSVVIPFFNREQYLADAIGSALAQENVITEVIAVDDGSTDASADAARSFGEPVRYVYQENAGAGAARNKGVELSTGGFLAFLDSDDVWPENRLRWQLRAFSEEPEIDMVFGHVDHFVSPELDESFKRSVKYPEQRMPAYLTGGFLIKRASFDMVGPFDAKWEVGEFIDWYMRAREKGLGSILLPQVVLLRRVHRTNKVLTHRGSYRDYLRIAKASLDRRRSGCTAIDDK